MSGLPNLMRIMGFGFRRPKALNPGRCLARTVEAVGKDVTELKPGDDVYGICDGSFAESSSLKLLCQDLLRKRRFARPIGSNAPGAHDHRRPAALDNPAAVRAPGQRGGVEQLGGNEIGHGVEGLAVAQLGVGELSLAVVAAQGVLGLGAQCGAVGLAQVGVAHRIGLVLGAPVAPSRCIVRNADPGGNRAVHTTRAAPAVRARVRPRVRALGVPESGGCAGVACTCRCTAGRPTFPPTYPLHLGVDDGGGGGNRTRVLRSRTRPSPSAAGRKLSGAALLPAAVPPRNQASCPQRSVGVRR